MRICKSYTKVERQQHIEDWKISSVSKAVCAKSAGISPTTFYNWFREPDNEKGNLVEINHRGKVFDNPQEIVIEKGRITIRVPLSSGKIELQTIFAALEGAQ